MFSESEWDIFRSLGENDFAILYIARDSSYVFLGLRSERIELIKKGLLENTRESMYDRQHLIVTPLGNKMLEMKAKIKEVIGQ